MTLQIANDYTLLPVIRFPSFSDETADLPIEQFDIPVGNEIGEQPKKIPLKEYLENASKYIQSMGKIPSLYTGERDKNILTSAQFCVLPLAKGTCEFNVHLYNYQSGSEPAVLVLIVSQAGTSAQFAVGNPLYFNQKGKACNFVAERLKDERERKGLSSDTPMNVDEQERNCLLVFQIPLKVKESLRSVPMLSEMCMPECKSVQSESFKCEDFESSRGMDDAMLRTGDSHSDFQGVDNKTFERDPQFPIRCTVQFYKVTDTDIVPESAFKDMSEKIDNVYKYGVARGSLVTSGNTGRTTEMK